MIARALLLVVAVIFAAGIGVLTVLDIADNGVTWLDVVALLVVVLFGTGIVGALLHHPENDQLLPPPPNDDQTGRAR